MVHLKSRQTDANRPPSREASGGPGKRRRRLPVWKKGLFAVLATLTVFAALEGALALVGVRPTVEESDPYVGFSGHAPLFVPAGQSGDERTLVTAENKLPFFNRQSFPREKAPDTTRIFCLGGSTTYGRPFDDATSFCGQLRELLRAAAPGRRWEVINAGGISYASYRVALVMEELLAYEPDVFIVYTGHNEFLEERTYGEIRDTPAALVGLETTLAHTRTYAALRRLLRDKSQPASDPRSILPAEVDAVLDRTVGPSAYQRDDALGEQILEHYAYNLERMVRLARSAGAKVIFVAPAANLGDCSPFKSQHRDGLGEADRCRVAELLAESASLAEGGDLDAALRAADEAAELDPRFAAAHYRRGRLLAEAGRFDEARQAFARALDEDVCPLRAPAAFVRRLRDVAAEHGVPLIDFPELVARHSPHGIPGEQLFLDHVHPTIDGHRLVAVALVETLVAEEVLTLPDDWGEDDVRAVAARIEEGIDPRTQARAYLNLAKVLTWSGKFAEADRPSLRAAEVLTDDAEAHYHRGLVLENTGHATEAAEHYRAAVALEPDFARAHNNLGALAAAAGDRPSAVAHYRAAVESDPDFALAHKNLGVHLAQSGRLDDAAEHFREALRFDPDDHELYYNLGRVHAAQEEREAAIEAFRRALEIQPDFAAARERLDALRERGSAD